MNWDKSPSVLNRAGNCLSGFCKATISPVLVLPFLGESMLSYTLKDFEAAPAPIHVLYSTILPDHPLVVSNPKSGSLNSPINLFLNSSNSFLLTTES